MKYLAANGRHLKTGVTMCLQYFNQIAPACRGQVDALVLLSTQNDSNIVKVHKEFASCCPLRIFRSAFLAATGNFGALIIDNTRHATTIKNICFTATVDWPLPETAKLGSDAYLRYAKRHYLDRQQLTARLKNDAPALSDGEDEDLQEVSDDQELFEPHHVFNDSKGRIIIRKVCALPEKQKIE